MSQNEFVGASTDDLTSERGKLIKKYKDALNVHRKGKVQTF